MYLQFSNLRNNFFFNRFNIPCIRLMGEFLKYFPLNPKKLRLWANLHAITM